MTALMTLIAVVTTEEVHLSLMVDVYLVNRKESQARTGEL
jgi:hypothetical protein